MVKKFLLFLMITTLSLMMCKKAESQSNTNFSIRLEISDTLYYREMVKVVAMVETNRYMPITLHLEKMVSPSITALAEKRVYLEIQHNNELYVETHPTLLISGDIERIRLSKWHSCRVLGMFYFDNLLPITDIDASNHKDCYKNRNREFGNYQFKAVFVTDNNDTIYSNPVNIWYLEKE